MASLVEARRRLHAIAETNPAFKDGSDAGEATYSVMIRSGEESRLYNLTAEGRLRRWRDDGGGVALVCA